MKPILLSGRSNPILAEQIAKILNLKPGKCDIENFPDGEIHVEIKEEIRGCDVYLIQSTSPPVADNLLELLLLADAARRAGASQVTGVIPYLGYARQDRRTTAGEPVGGRVAADILSSGLDRIISVDLHKPTFEGFFSCPVEHLSAIPLLAETIKRSLPDNPVLVAPDLGAAKLANTYADILDIPVAYIYKVRESGEKVTIRNIVGDVADCCPILVDDMISTAGTMVKAMQALLSQSCRSDITLIATHGLFVGEGPEKILSFPVSRIVVTDSIVQTDRQPLLPIHVAGLNFLLANAIKKLSL
ncbi:MAG: ribose-phosphate pyrophosphokinase [Desulfobacterales bacterium]